MLTALASRFVFPHQQHPPKSRTAGAWHLVVAPLGAFLLIHAIAIASVKGPKQPTDLAQYVDPFIGTTHGGHVFCGATRPFGVVKSVWDTAGGGAQGGYVSDHSPVYGISQTHDSGTGGAYSLGNFQLLPQLCIYAETSAGTAHGCATRQWERIVQRSYKSGDAVATPGYFYQKLASGIKTETTVTNHVALHRFDYTAAIASADASVESGMSPDSSLAETHASSQGVKEGPTLLLDLTNDLPHTYQSVGSLEIRMDPMYSTTHTATVTGFGIFEPSFGKGRYEIYFCASLPGVKAAGAYSEDAFKDGGKTLLNPSNATESGALFDISTDWLAANNNTLPVRIAISFVSIQQACKFAENEASDWTQQSHFDEIKADARATWNELLGVSLTSDLKGVPPSVVTNFYSSLYRTYIAPTNVTGDNARWNSTEPAYDSLYCIWDTFRAVHPLYALLNPNLQAEIVRSVIDVWRFEGWMPDCRMSTNMGYVQGGSNSDSMLADSYVKGVRAGINWQDGLRAMLTNAEGLPADWGVQGRGGIAARKALGYVPRDGQGDDPPGATVTPGRSASRTLEYAFNDASIAFVAAGLGNRSIYEDYLARSGDWVNLWNPHLRSDNYGGFIQPRFTNGSFSFIDPRRCSPDHEPGKCYLLLAQRDSQFYEASAWQYSFYAPHNMQKVVGLMGGSKRFLDRLDHLWDARYGDIGNELGFLPTYQYNYAPGGYSRTVDRVLKTLRSDFNVTTSGVPGNDDSGAMGAYVVWGTLGLFPVAGTSVYLFATPLLPGWSIRSMLTGKTATLRTVNFDGAIVNKYIVSAKLDGVPYTKNWIDHDTLFLQGKTLEITLGPSPGKFGASVEDVPPSVSTGAFSFDTASRGI